MRIAVLHHGSAASRALTRFRACLLTHGLADGVNCVIDAEGAEGRWSQLPLLTQQLLQRQPDVLVALGALAALSAQRATSRVPILHAIVLDPSDIGLTAPNVTGVTSFDPEQAERHLRLLKQLLPGLRRVGFIDDVDAPAGREGRNPLVVELLAAAAPLGLEVHGVALSGVDGCLHQAFDTLQQTGSQALVALEVPTVLARLDEIMQMAECRRLPTLAPHGWSCGALVMEGASLHDALDPLAESVARVARGAGVESVETKVVRHHRLVVRLDCARRIGLAIPATLLHRASLCIDEAAG